VVAREKKQEIEHTLYDHKIKKKKKIKTVQSVSK